MEIHRLKDFKQQTNKGKPKSLIVLFQVNAPSKFIDWNGLFSVSKAYTGSVCIIETIIMSVI